MHRIKSMPNLEYGRSAHNRVAGQTMLESVSECGRATGKVDATVNVAELEMLLADL